MHDKLRTLVRYSIGFFVPFLIVYVLLQFVLYDFINDLIFTKLNDRTLSPMLGAMTFAGIPLGAGWVSVMYLQYRDRIANM